MKVYSSSLELLDSDVKNRPFLHLTVGNFDGLHLGHQALLRQAFECRERYGGLVGVYSFNPHPQDFFKPFSEHIYLENRNIWRERLAQYGVDILIEEKFTKEFSLLDPDTFLNTYWGPFLNLKSLTVGEDFRFGSERRGDRQKLISWCHQQGIEFYPIKPVLMEGQRVSSTRIKNLLKEGLVTEVAKLLGRPFSIKGIVQKGDQRGRQLGFPTLNQIEVSANLLRRGVYSTHVILKGKSYLAVTNVGVRPTVHAGSTVVVESNIIEPLQGEFYGEVIEVHFGYFIREEKKFSSLDELRNQISADVKLAQQRVSKL